MNEQFTYDRIMKLMETQDSHDELENIIKNGNLSPVEVKNFFNAIRDARLNTLFEDLEIDEKKLDKARKKKIKLSPKSRKWPLLSTPYRDHEGKYVVEDLIYEYHDSVLREGILIGRDYGRKFAVEDIKNKRFGKEDILNMTKNELEEYCDENREEI